MPPLHLTMCFIAANHNTGAHRATLTLCACQVNVARSYRAVAAQVNKFRVVIREWYALCVELNMFDIAIGGSDDLYSGDASGVKSRQRDRCAGDGQGQEPARAEIDRRQ